MVTIRVMVMVLMVVSAIHLLAFIDLSLVTYNHPINGRKTMFDKLGTFRIIG